MSIDGINPTFYFTPTQIKGSWIINVRGMLIGLNYVDQIFTIIVNGNLGPPTFISDLP